MPFRGWFEYAGREIANSSRVVEAMETRLPEQDQTALDELPEPSPLLYEPVSLPDVGDMYGVGPLQETSPFLYAPGYIQLVNDQGGCGCSIRVPYDDSWPNLGSWLGDLQSGHYQILNAPWYDVKRPESQEFMGVWVMSVDGFDSLPVEREISASLCAGGAAGPVKYPPREVSFDALVVGCTEAGARYGVRWLSRRLRVQRSQGAALRYLGAHPYDTEATPESLRRELRGVVLTQAPSVTDRSGLGGSERHHQASILRCEFAMTALNPYEWGPSHVVAASLNESPEPIVWQHDTSCVSPSDCDDAPVLFSETCSPYTVTVNPVPPPSCSGCMPLCSVKHGTWLLPIPVEMLGEVAVSMSITNTGSRPLSLETFWTLPGATDLCDEQNAMLVAGLPPGATIELDSVDGRAYGVVNGERVRQAGIVSSRSGAPWSPMVVDSSDQWTLHVRSAPGDTFTVDIELQERLS